MSGVLADKVEVWGLDSDFVIFSDGSLGFCLELDPVDPSCWDSDASNDFHDGICQFLNSLPSGIDLQFIQNITSGNDEPISENRRLAEACQDPFIRKLSIRRSEQMQEYDDFGLMPVFRVKLVVRKKLSKPLIGKVGIFSNDTKFKEIAESVFETEIRSVSRLASDLEAQLKSIGVSAKRVVGDQIVKELYRQWNPTRPVGLGSYDPGDLRNSVLFTDAVVEKEGFSLGEMNYKVLSLKSLPSQTYSAMVSTLNGLPFESKLIVTINSPDQSKEIEALQTQRRLAFSMVYGKKTGVSDLESEAKLDDIEGLIAELISQGEKVFHFGLNVVLCSKSLDELDEQVSATLMAIRDLSGAEAMVESAPAFDIFADSAFPNSRVRDRTRRIKTSNLADLIPLYGPWPGHDEPKILLRSRSGSLVKFNPFSKRLTNGNQIISGGSGSGKSFLTNLLLIQMLKEDVLIYIVDIGGSYQKTFDNLSGQYIPLGLDDNLSINPFDLATGESEPSSEKIKMLLALVECMTKEESESNLKKLERSEIEEAIHYVYENFPKPKLSHLRDQLLSHSMNEIKKIGRILGPWCGDSPYGKFVDRETTVDLSRPRVCFDLKGLEQYPDLQRACLIMISDLVIRTSQKDRSTMKFLVFDECWALLEGEGASFIGSIFRTCRKYFMSCIAISQNIDDFARSTVAAAIMTNSSIKWILRQKGADKKRLQEVLELNGNEVAMISSLSQKKGYYSEAFLMCEDEKSLVAVESTPYEYWLATTDPRDLALLEREAEAHPEKDQKAILIQVAEKYPQGAPE